MTKNAKLILDIVKTSHEHPTAKEIYERMKILSPGTVMATVYNNLTQLTEKGLVRKIEIPNDSDRYDRTEIPHEHLICEKCGQLCDTMFEDMTETLKEKSGENITSYSLIIKYICKDCKTALNN